jgi:SPP1 gp7 family putative phage head morphogenesis protein
LQNRKIFREIEASYTHNDCYCDECNTTRLEYYNAISLEPYNKLIEKITKDLHDGTLEPSDLNADLIKQIYTDLSEGTKKTFGNKWEKLDVKEPNSLIQKFKKNLWQFSSAKTLAELEKMNSLLLDKGKIRTFDEFKKLVQKENVNFNSNYLRAEFETAKRGSEMAWKWKDYVKNADLFPNLEYRTVNDERVRPEHAVLSGVIKPINDSFWRTFYPPNGWRCRCYVVQTASNVTPGRKDDPTVLPEFRGNVALDEEIFTQKGSFFKLLNKDYKAKANAELMKLNAPYDEAYKNKKGKKVMVNIFADENDKLKNIESAMVIVDQLDVPVVYIRPHVNVQKHKNPEYFINGVVSDLKNLETTKGITHAFDTAKEQFKDFNSHSLVFDLSNVSISKKEIIDQLNNKVTKTRGKKIKELYFIKGNKACVLDRNQIINGDFKALDDIL